MISKFQTFTYFQERNRAAKELFHIVSSELREVPAEELSVILDQLTKQMLDNVKVIEVQGNLFHGGDALSKIIPGMNLTLTRTCYCIITF